MTLFYRGIILAIFVCALDQIHKWYMLDVFGIIARDPVKVTEFFNLVMVWNRGVSFGMGSESKYAIWIFSALTIVIVSALVWWMKKAEERLIIISLGLIVGGAIGNLIDRLRFGAVADFFDFHMYGYHWPAFNIADSAVFLGAAMLILDSIKQSSPKKDT